MAKYEGLCLDGPLDGEIGKSETPEIAYTNYVIVGVADNVKRAMLAGAHQYKWVEVSPLSDEPKVGVWIPSDRDENWARMELVRRRISTNKTRRID